MVDVCVARRALAEGSAGRAPSAGCGCSGAMTGRPRRCMQMALTRG